ncbi:hypothetical protein AVEN_187791-1 [Araneus ventricosus]|uniref:Uncharacterized protein n=1 Tax=Araneus ventricosus TaxID=182803 RepID=A0A4Y2P8F7_ARAVE|nr:hypothetical protein AVEN_187791-1 [Araneus ventricosus]
MVGRIDAPAKCELHSFIRFFQAEGDQCSCFLPDFAKSHLELSSFMPLAGGGRSAVVTQQLLEQFKWDVSDLPAYSPDFATSDFHLFPELN